MFGVCWIVILFVNEISLGWWKIVKLNRYFIFKDFFYTRPSYIKND